MRSRGNIFERNAGRRYNVQRLYELKGRPVGAPSRGRAPAGGGRQAARGARAAGLCRRSVSLLSGTSDDHLRRIDASIGTMRDTIGAAIDANLSMVMIEDSETTKRLAAWAGIFGGGRTPLCGHLGHELRAHARTRPALGLSDVAGRDHLLLHLALPALQARRLAVMDAERPDPDALLEQIKQEEAEARRGQAQDLLRRLGRRRQDLRDAVVRTRREQAGHRRADRRGRDPWPGRDRGAGRRHRTAAAQGTSYRDRSLKEFDLEGSRVRGRALHSNMTDPAPTALIVEDEPQIRRFVRAGARSRGLGRARIRDECDEGLERDAARRKPDLVILDLELPDGDGIDLIRGVRAWSGHADHRAVGAEPMSRTRSKRSTPARTTTSPSPLETAELLARVRARVPPGGSAARRREPGLPVRRHRGRSRGSAS